MLQVAHFIRQRVINEKLSIDEYCTLFENLVAAVAFDPIHDQVLIKRDSCIRKEFAKFIIDDSDDGTRIFFEAIDQDVPQ